MAQFNNKKGFSLPELLAVMAIMAILAATSSPFIRGYIKDAANDKAKAMLQLIAQSYKTFKADYPNAKFNQSSVNGSSAAANCSVSTDPDTPNSPGLLKSCHYLQNVNWISYKYDFYVGYSCCSDAPGTAMSCMKGTATSGDYTSTYCAWVDQYGALDDNKD